MTFKNIKFNTCLSFPRIRISSLCHMWPGKFLVIEVLVNGGWKEQLFNIKMSLVTYFRLHMFVHPKWNKKIAHNLLVLFSCHHAMLFCSSFLPLLTIGYFLARVFLVAKFFPKWLKFVFSGPSSHQIFLIKKKIPKKSSDFAVRF